MTAPSFNDPFSALYDDYSVLHTAAPKHAGCFVYLPDNYDDYQCLAIWQPAPELGARSWTRNGKRILIGVYRDEGRNSAPGANFAEDHIVFRLLPSFKLVPVATVIQLLAAADPSHSRAPVSLTDVATGSTTLASDVATATTSTLHRRHRQQLDELKRPLGQRYDARGRVIPPDLRFSKHSNAALYVNVPMIGQHEAPSSNPRLPVYDFYGFDLNDPARGPFYSDHVVSYSSGSSNGIQRATTVAGSVIYPGIIHDVFGDYVVGARPNNTLVTRKPVQPLRVDQSNTPYKRPIGRG